MNPKIIIRGEVYTQEQLKAEGILTTEYALNLEVGDYEARLDLKAKARSGVRVFFTLKDGRKFMAVAQWFNQYLGFYGIPVGTELLLHYTKNTHGEVFLTSVEQI